MITVTVHRDARGRVVGFQSEGHAGYADYGQDIVCAAVSALTQTAVLGLTEHAGADVDVEQKSGWLRCTLKQGAEPGPSATAVLETMILGLDAVARQYPQQVRVRDEAAGSDEGGQDRWPS